MVIARRGSVLVGVRDEGENACLFGSITAFLFGLIQRLVRGFDQIGGGGGSAWDDAGKADADRDEFAVGMCNPEGLNTLAKCFRHLGRSVRAGAGEDDHEFVAAITSDQVSRSVDGSRDRSSHLPEAFVAGRMPMGIVIRFEAIDVEHDQGERRRFANRSTPFLVQKVVELSAIGNAGEAVEAGEAQEHLVRFLELAHDLKEFLLASLPTIDFVNQAQDRPDARQQFDFVDGLPNIVECACGKGELEIDRIGLDGDHHNGRVTESFDRLDLAAGFDAVHLRHNHIHEDEVDASGSTLVAIKPEQPECIGC